MGAMTVLAARHDDFGGEAGEPAADKAE